MENSMTTAGCKGDRAYLHWTVAMDTALSNALLEQHNLGHKTLNEWKSIAFTASIAAMKETCKIDITKDRIIGRLKTWNKYYKEVTAMLNTSGFGWDWDKHTMKVDSEDAWDNYVKAHSGVKHYRGKVIMNWRELRILCGNDRATGGYAATANETADGESMADESQTPRDRSRFEGEGSARANKRRVVGVDALAEAIAIVAASMNKSNDLEAVTEAQQSVVHAKDIYTKL